MLNVLFVDDDSLILAGLQRKFRRFSDVWRMEFVTSGEEALARLAKTRFQVVITDLRMPGMDGGQLLQRIKELYPRTLRLILSGQSGHEAAFRTLGPAHQFLLKPCDPSLMQDVLVRGIALQQRLAASKIEALIQKIPALPSLPEIFQKVVGAASSNQASVGQVGQVIAEDAALTANLMQVLNSPNFTLSRSVSDPTEAAKLLGLDMLTSLVLYIGVVRQFELNALGGFSLEQVLQHGIEVGQLARQLAKTVVDNEYVAHDALLAGVLHDVGKLALAACDKDAYREVLQLAHRKSLTLWHAEQTVFGVTHAEVGGFLLNTWGLSQPIVEAVALHHDPSAFGGSRFSPLTAVHVANGMIHERSPKWLQGTSSRIDDKYVASLDQRDKITGWISQDAELIES
jgi:putative nucleotidyltransferase with HDIG domain